MALPTSWGRYPRPSLIVRQTMGTTPAVYMIFCIEVRELAALGKCWGTVRDGPPDTGIHWDELETNRQLSGMVRYRAGSVGMNLRTLPN